MFELPSPSACRHLARFICCLPCLTNLTITRIDLLHDDFFIDFASMAASSKIHTLHIGFQWDRMLELPSPSAWKHLARFICCLPCLTNLAITGIDLLHDDFFIDFASMAASSKIHTLVLGFQRVLHGPLSSSACKHLARFICCLPCLTNLTITGIGLLHGDFFIDFASMAASSKVI
nr:uncharacterized protein LOC129267856 [Lytechinus pictus]